MIANTILAPQCATSSCHNREVRVSDLSFETPQDAIDALADQGALDTAFVGSGGVVGCNPLLLWIGGGSAGAAGCPDGDGELTMPPDAPLPLADVALIEAWLSDGAPYP